MIKSYTVTATDLYWLIVSVTFLITSVLCSCCWYAKRQHTSFKTALLVLWQEGVVAGVKAGTRSVLPTAKTAWSYTKRLALAFWEYLKPSPGKHPFTPALYEALYHAVKEYIYAPFQPVITVRYTPYPSAVYVAFYTKSAITPEVTAEVVWHLQAAFQEYLTCYGLTFDYTAVPFVQDNSIEVWLYYAETPVEHPAYRTACRQAMLMKADPLFQPLPESAVPKTSDLVLGYDYEQWKSSGRIVPIKWDIAAAPHLIVAGPSGGGKSIYTLSLIERLLLLGADLSICDFKGYGDYKALHDRCAVGNECNAMLQRFCADFEAVRDSGHLDTGRMKCLVFEEFGSFSASKSKKEYDELMKQISGVIFMGRSYGYHIILVSQRFDADTLKTSLREQFGVRVYMGTSISQQSATMLYPNSVIDKASRLEPYCGYACTPTTDNTILITPKVDVAALNIRLKALSAKSG